MSTNGQIRIKPASILLYGRSKIGKSSQFIRGFGPKALYIACERGAILPGTIPNLNPWRHDGTRVAADGPNIVLPRDLINDPGSKYPTLDFVEAVSTTDPFGEVEKMIDTYAVPGIDAGRYGAVVLDGLTEWTERIWAWINATIEAKHLAHGRGFSNHLFPKVKGIVRRLLELGVWFGAVAHEREPSNFEGRVKLGAPNLIGGLGDSTPQFFDVVLHCEVGTLPGRSRERIFHCDPLDPDWITGERFGVMAQREPADLREILKRVAARQRGEAITIPVFETPKEQQLGF